MTIHPEGYKIINIAWMSIAIIIMLINLIFPVQSIYHIIIYVILLKILFIVIFFFRVPKRNFNFNENFVLSSADGKVVAIEEVFENEYFKSKMIQVSVFMSLYNIHINWLPFSGKIVYVKYHAGKYIIASHPKSSEHNEHASVVVENSKGKAVLIRQIAGAIAKRIVCYAKEGREMPQCSELGFIKFGSRVDLFLPLEAEIKVKLGQKVKGGIDAIAAFKQ